MATHGSFLCSNIWQLFCDLRRFTSIYVDLYANLRRSMSIYVDLCWFTSIYVQRWPRWQPKYAKTKAQIKKYPSIMIPTKVGRPPPAVGPPLWGTAQGYPLYGWVFLCFSLCFCVSGVYFGIHSGNLREFSISRVFLEGILGAAEHVR